MARYRIIGVVLTLLLVWNGAAEAGFQIGTRYLDDRPFDPDTDMLDIGDSLYLSIYTEESFGWPSDYGYYWALVCDPSLAGITGGEAGPDADYVAFGASVVDVLYGVPGDGRWGVMWAGGLEIGSFFEPGLYLDNFLYSPQSVGDITVSFWHLTYDPWDGPPYGVVDSIVINQVPEPATITLVALGGLFVLRRRR